MRTRNSGARSGGVAMIGPRDARTRDLPDPDGEKFGVPTYYWGTAPAGLGETERQLAKHEPPLRPGDKKDIAAQLIRPRGGSRGPLFAYLYRVEDAVPKREAHPWERESLARGHRTQSEDAMRRRGIDPLPENPSVPERSGGWDGFER
ncbi:hypothetical protein AB0L82_43285 [Nocardia sp. NPDC052001]|uniref:hypothetical protein n=1 Tax=Nocardia sp. NPDC052001 TaxID=3154853 RepID=UPI00343CBB03